MLSADDKVDEDDFENDTEEEDIVNDEDYKEKDEDDEDDDDDDKVVMLARNNEEHFYQEDDSMVLISLTKMKMMKNYPRARRTPWLHQHINWKNISKLDGYNQICELQYKSHSNLA